MIRQVIGAIVLLAAMLAFLATPMRAQGWSCDGPPQSYIDDCDNGDCWMLWVYWSWWQQNCS